MLYTNHTTRSIFEIVEELRAVCERTLQEADEAEAQEIHDKELMTRLVRCDQMLDRIDKIGGLL